MGRALRETHHLHESQSMGFASLYPSYVCYGLLRLARNDEIASSRATKQPDGQITKILSSPLAKNIPLNPSGKSKL
jgi:hypothetical protein